MTKRKFHLEGIVVEFKTTKYTDIKCCFEVFYDHKGPITYTFRIKGPLAPTLSLDSVDLTKSPKFDFCRVHNKDFIDVALSALSEKESLTNMMETVLNILNSLLEKQDMDYTKSGAVLQIENAIFKV